MQAVREGNRRQEQKIRSGEINYEEDQMDFPRRRTEKKCGLKR